MKKQLVSLLAISTSFLILFLVAFIISSLFSKQPQLNVEELLKVFAVPPNQFAPEPQERWIYITNTLLTPLLCGGFYLLFTKMVKGEKIARIKILHWIVSPVFLFLLVYLAILDFQFASFKYVHMSGFIQYPWITLIINVGIIASLLRKHNYPKVDKSFLTKHIGAILFWGIGCLILILAGLETVFNEYEPYIPHIHFIAYFDSVVQVFMGKHILVDFNPQYGAYAWLLNPIFQVIGLNVLKFTITMGILKIIIYGSFLVLLYKLVDNKLIAFLSFATIFFYTRMRAPIELLKAPHFEYNPQTINYPGLLDPYFQYNPHRMLFPVLLVLLSWFYIASHNVRINKLIYVINNILSALATLWNPDTGMVVTIAWIGLLSYQEFNDFKKNKLSRTFLNLVRHALALMIAYGVVFGIFVASTYLETGLLPNFASSAEYTQLFYFSGYYMLRMPILHPWNMVILAYLVGIYFSIRGLLMANQDSAREIDTLSAHSHDQDQFIFLISIIGIGLFNYYVGRSHDYNLIATVWPVYILLAIYIEKLFKHVAPIFWSVSFNWKIKLRVVLKNYFQVSLFIGLIYFSGSSLVSIAGNLPAYVNLIHARIAPIQQGMPTDLDSLVQFIKKTSTTDEPVFIISDYAPELYLYTQHARPINIDGFGEIILREDVVKIQNYLTNPPPNAKIYWDQRFYTINSYTYNINPYDFPNLIPQEASPDKNIVLFTTRH